MREEDLRPEGRAVFLRFDMIGIRKAEPGVTAFTISPKCDALLPALAGRILNVRPLFFESVVADAFFGPSRSPSRSKLITVSDQGDHSVGAS